MIIIGDDVDKISTLKTLLQQHFEMKDLSHLNYFFSLEVLSKSNGYYLSHVKYTSSLLARTCLTNSKIASTPLESNAKRTPLDGIPLEDDTLYRQLVDNLVYLTIT